MTVENYNGSWREGRQNNPGVPVIWQFIRDDKNFSQSDTRGNYRRTLRTAKVMPGNYARHARRSENPLPHGQPMALHLRWNCTCRLPAFSPSRLPALRFREEPSASLAVYQL